MGRILIIHDASCRLKEVAFFLKERGGFVSPPRDNLESDSLFQYIDEKRINVILIESSFPSLNIFKFLRKLRSNQSTATVLLLGPMPSPEMVALMLRAGVFDFLKTPISFDHLEKTIRQGLKNRRKLKSILQLSDRLKHAYKKITEDRNRLQQWNDDLNRLHLLHQTLGESLNMEEVIQSFVTSLKNLMAFDAVALFLKGEERARVYVDQVQPAPLLSRISMEILLRSGAGWT